MPRPRNLLTDRQVRTVGDGWHSDGGNLYLRVIGPRRSWVLRYASQHGEKTSTGARKVVELGLGPVDRVSLKEARDLRDQHLAKLTQNLDPKAEKRKARATAENRKTFGWCAAQVIEARGKGWRTNDSTGRESSVTEWRRTLEVDCEPFADRFVDEVGVDDVKKAVARYWAADQHISLRRGLNRIELVLEWALAHGFRPENASNPAAWKRMQHIFPIAKQNGGPHGRAAVDWRDMPAFMVKLRKVEDSMTAPALELIILTAARMGEVLGMRWSEVDLDDKLWAVPASRMKAGREHYVPLSDAAISLLRKMEALRRRVDDYVFPGDQPGRAITPQAVWFTTNALTDGAATTHGMRASFKSWSVAQRIDRDIAERCLAHATGGTEGRYDREDLFDHRLPVMQLWADYLAGKAVAPATAEVVPLKRGKRRKA